MARFPGFPPEALRFLRALEKNNDRDWFQANKSTYETKLKGPLTELILALGEELDKFAPGLQTDPKKAIYRIYRDIRFSPNKKPYKTHAAASFTAKSGEKHVDAGYYFHFSPKELLIGGGLYMPGSPELLAIRRRLSADSAGYRKLTRAAAFKRLFGDVQGDKLTRAPKGFSPDDPALDLLVYKQYLAADTIDPKLVETPKLLPEIVKRFKALQPWIDWINEAIRDGRGTRGPLQ